MGQSEAVITAETGTLWLRTSEAIDSKQDFLPAPRQMDFVDGQARMYLDEQDTPPAITTASLQITIAMALLWSCYIPSVDAETGEESNEKTGDTGNAIFGAPTGVQT